MKILFFILAFSLTLQASYFAPKWQVELYSFFENEPGLAVLHEDALYFTEWRARNDCPGNHLYKVSLLNIHKPERLNNFYCVFKIWTLEDGILVAYKNSLYEKNLLFKLLKNNQWSDVEQKEIIGALKQTKREYLDTISLCDKNTFSLEKKKKIYTLKNISEQKNIQVFEIKNRLSYPVGPSRFVACLKDFFVWLEDQEEDIDASLWSLSKNGEVQSFPLMDADSISGISTYQEGIVVSYANRRQVYWFGNNVNHFKKEFNTPWTHIRHNSSSTRKGDNHEH